MPRRGRKALLLIPALLLCLGSECDIAEPDDNFVTVHVTAILYVELWDYTGPTRITRPWAGAHVELETIKDGGERVVEAGPTAGDGSFGPITATFKVYRGQPVEAKGRILGGILPPSLGEDPWDPTKFKITVRDEKLRWETIKDLMGSEYFWYPDVEIELAYPLP